MVRGFVDFSYIRFAEQGGRRIRARHQSETQRHESTI